MFDHVLQDLNHSEQDRKRTSLSLKPISMNMSSNLFDHASESNSDSDSERSFVEMKSEPEKPKPLL